MNYINIHVLKESVGLQVFDRWYAYRHRQRADSGYQSNIEITFGEPAKNCINVAYAYMPDSWVNPHDYDIIIYENCSEGLEVATEEIRGGVIQPMGYFLCGAYTSVKQRFHSDIIPWSLCHGLFLDRHVRPFYPGFYDRERRIMTNRKPLWYINGQRRTWRQLLLETILQRVPDLKVHDSISQDVWVTGKSFFESDEDTKFRLYLDDGLGIDQTTDYYSSAIPIGINQKFGTIARGWFVMPEYYEYHCTVYPESTWMNNEIQPNEKFFKCCLARSIPFPVGGAETHALYSYYGFKTAWHLLPDDLQDFDFDLDHISRYRTIARAVEWFVNNPDVFQSTPAQHIREQNYARLFEPSFDLTTMETLDRIFKL